LIEEATLTASRSRRPGRLVTVALAAGASAVLAVSLVGCSSGLVNQTASQVPPVPGANVDAGSIALRNLVVLYNGTAGYPVGSDAPLVVRLFNNSTRDVTLIGVTAANAASVSLVGSPTVVTSAPATTAAASTATTTPPATASASVTVSGSTTPESSESESPTTTTSPSATATAPATPVRITIPAQSYVLLVPGQGSQGYLQLNSLTQAIVPGGFTSVTFTFDDGSKVDVDIPLAPPTTEVPRATPVVANEHEE
jgi:hypothetical protein